MKTASLSGVCVQLVLPGSWVTLPTAGRWWAGCPRWADARSTRYTHKETSSPHNICKEQCVSRFRWDEMPRNFLPHSYSTNPIIPDETSLGTASKIWNVFALSAASDNRQVDAVVSDQLHLKQLVCYKVVFGLEECFGTLFIWISSSFNRRCIFRCSSCNSVK